jgi:hypothetical protein
MSAVYTIIASHIIITNSSIVRHESGFILMVNMFQIIFLSIGTLERDMAIPPAALALLAPATIRGLLNIDNINFVVSVDGLTIETCHCVLSVQERLEVNECVAVFN